MNYNLQAIQTRKREWQGIKRCVTIGFSIGGSIVFLLSIVSSIAHN